MKFDTAELRDNINSAHRKESGFYRQLSALDPRDGSAIVTARFYWPGRDGASNCYCCVWIHGDKMHGAGSGKAGGYGYHKESAALLSALNAAGAYVSEDIGGRGDRAMRDALTALALKVTGKRKVFFFEAHA
jgi:hypothetical protein